MGFVNWLLKPFTDCFQQPEIETNTKILTLEESEELKRQEKLAKRPNLKDLMRPQTFKDYIGQQRAKKLINAYILGTQKRNKVFPHFLIHGNAGCGKTTLARILANKLGVDFIELLSRNIDSPDEVIEIVSDLGENGILFIDEIHGLSRETVEAIYPVLEDMRIDGEEKQFTLIGATTELGEIIKDRRPFYDRFKIKLELEEYKRSDIGRIIYKYNTRVFKDEILSKNDRLIISSNSRFTPRIAISQLESAIYLGSVNTMLDSLGIIADGYTIKDLSICKYISSIKSGVGIQSILSYLGTSAENYMYEIEPYLIKTEVLVRTNKGRIITDKGIKLIRKLERIKKLRKMV